MRSTISIGGSGSWALPGPNKFAAAAGQQIFKFEARTAFRHVVPRFAADHVMLIHIKTPGRTRISGRPNTPLPPRLAWRA